MNKVAGLVIGYRPTASMGRVAFWVVFGLCVYFWLARPVEAFPPSLETAMGFTLAYNFGGKAVNQFSHRPGGDRREHSHGAAGPQGKAYDDSDED